MFDTVQRHWGSDHSVHVGKATATGDWCLDIARATAFLESKVREKEPLTILGTAFSYIQLIDGLPGHFTLPPGSRAMETGGYKGRTRKLPKEELYVLIRKALGIEPTHIVSEYGMSELSSQAYDGISGTIPLGQRRIFHFPPWARAQVINPEDGQEVGEGEIGLVRILDLANAYSVMAIQTEDVGIRRGSGFELAGRAENSEPRGCSLRSVVARDAMTGRSLQG